MFQTFERYFRFVWRQIELPTYQVKDQTSNFSNVSCWRMNKTLGNTKCPIKKDSEVQRLETAKVSSNVET